MTLERAEHALAAGNLIEAYNLAREAAVAGVDDPRIRYLEVLSLARMGDVSQASDLYETYNLAAVGSADALSLKARLLKDEALAEAEPRPSALLGAAEVYKEAFNATGDPFPLVNAASLAGAAGEWHQSRALAELVLQHPQLVTPRGYWSWITKAEALLVLGREDEAAQAARVALAEEGASLGARSSTIKQFERLLPLLSASDQWTERFLGILRPPPVIHFCGHMFSEANAAEEKLTHSVRQMLEESAVEIGYGALAAGSDMIIAELLLERGAELNVVLPFPLDEFKRVSVFPAGAAWLQRFERSCDQATSVTIVSDMSFVNDPRQLGYGAEVAMGLAVLRASHLGGQALQIAIWDGQETGFAAGTFADMSTWKAAGRPAEIIPYPVARIPGEFRSDVVGNAQSVERGAHSILFADFSGFSKIGEHNLLLFWNEVMGNIARVVERFSDAVLCKNTWGDALYLIIDGAAVAAELALALQEQVRSLDLVQLGPESSGMRVALHYGTMYRANDPVTKRTNFFGSEVSRAARLEPVTPKHSVYVTQPFAAVLALKQEHQFDLHYVGAIALAKNYGNQPVYRLNRRASHSRN